MATRNRFSIRDRRFPARPVLLLAAAACGVTASGIAAPLIGDLQPITICLTAGTPDPCVPFMDDQGNGWGVMSYAPGVRPPVLIPGEQVQFTGQYCTDCILPFCGSFAGFIFDATHEPCPSTPPPPTPDLNGDGHVDGLDLALLLGQWGGCPVCIIGPCPCPADLDASGGVNGLDLAILLGAWG